jgi:hypothetical protein
MATSNGPIKAVFFVSFLIGDVPVQELTGVAYLMPNPYISRSLMVEIT